MTKATDYKRQYNAEHYERFTLWLDKGLKAEIRRLAEAEGKSINAWINEAIKEKRGV